MVCLLLSPMGSAHVTGTAPQSILLCLLLFTILPWGILVICTGVLLASILRFILKHKRLPEWLTNGPRIVREGLEQRRMGLLLPAVLAMNEYFWFIVYACVTYLGFNVAFQLQVSPIRFGTDWRAITGICVLTLVNTQFDFVRNRLVRYVYKLWRSPMAEEETGSNLQKAASRGSN
jgi:hypothetical protein